MKIEELCMGMNVQERKTGELKDACQKTRSDHNKGMVLPHRSEYFHLRS
jgi:hypothetical protein